MDLRGRTALVTGAARRVGRAIALHLAERGAHLAVHHHQSVAAAESAAAEIVTRGGRAHVVQSDLSDPNAAIRLVDDVVSAFGSLDILVNSAAVMQRTPFGSVTAAEWDAMMALNVRAPFLLAQAAAPHLARATGGGAIVNIADLAAFETWPAYVPHGVSKAGIVYLTRALARLLAPAVRVNAVAPGAVLPPADWGPAQVERLRASTPLQRIGDPIDVARAVAFLLESDYVTGETILVDGGRHIR